jgi:hypothetical protein
MYAQKIGKPQELVQLTIKEFYPKDAISPDRVQDIDKVIGRRCGAKISQCGIDERAGRGILSAPKTVEPTIGPDRYPCRPAAVYAGIRPTSWSIVKESVMVWGLAK